MGTTAPTTTPTAPPQTTGPAAPRRDPDAHPDLDPRRLCPEQKRDHILPAFPW